MRVRASKPPPLSSTSNSNPTPSMSPPLNSPPPSGSLRRCEGLDLLVLAAMEVFGYRALEKERIGSNGVGKEEKRKEELDGIVEACPKWKTRRGQLAMPSRFRDSVLQPWKRRARRRLSGA